jgi:hypothetical protein
MRYATRSKLARLTSPLSVLAFLPMAMAIQATRPAGDQDAGVRVEAARARLGSRVPSQYLRVDPCRPDPASVRLPVEGIVLPDLHEHPWPRPPLAVAADILASGVAPLREAERDIQAPGPIAESWQEAIVPPALKPEPWPAPPAVRAWLEPEAVAYLAPDPPSLVPVTLPHETLTDVTLARIPWPAPEESTVRTPGRCPIT